MDSDIAKCLRRPDLVPKLWTVVPRCLRRPGPGAEVVDGGPAECLRRAGLVPKL